MRDGDDLHYLLMISYPQAVLGTDAQVPTLEGPATVRIQSGTQHGEVIRVRGKGMPRFRGYGRGDLLVRVGIAVPKKTTPRQRALLEELAQESDEEVQAKSRRFRL
jgi:molecular chaperone DnaJ